MDAPDSPPEIFTVLSTKNEEGSPIFSVLVKRTYSIRSGEKAVRCELTEPFIQEDQYYDHGDPEWATVKYESELASYKLATDVVVIGKALAPSEESVEQLEVSVAIADYKKTLLVTGDRYCIYRWLRRPLFTDPVPFKDMEIRYERAYGGKDEKSDPKLPFIYPRNPMGTGVALKNKRAVIDKLVLPNIEDPNDLLTIDRLIMGKPERWNEQPLPAGLGWFHRTWYPRCSFVASMPSFIDVDTVFREEALGFVPKGQVVLSRQFKLPSFDLRFNNGASLGMVLPYLKGDERVQLKHLTPGGECAFSLPGEPPQIMLDIGLGENVLKPFLQTVCIRLKEMEVDLIWRGAHEYPGQDWLPEMKKMVTHVS